jgi:acetyl-CoA acetyltransferase
MGLGGASAASGLVQGKLWIDAGICRTVLIVGADNQATGLTRDEAVAMYRSFRHPEFEQPFGLHNPAAYALIAARHMYQYGTQPEDLASIAVAIRDWAQLNEAAYYRDPLTVPEVLASRLVASPLHLFDCSSFADGGAALVMQSGSHLSGAIIRGYGMGFTHDHIIAAPRLTSTGARLSGRRAFEMAGCTPQDISIAELYDSYTIAVLVQLEDLGFCGPGEGASFIRDRGIGPGGELPVATHGGLLSHGHPGAPGGIYHLTEAVRQLNGTAGRRQVADAELVLVHGEGGILSANCTLILSRTG